MPRKRVGYHIVNNKYLSWRIDTLGKLAVFKFKTKNEMIKFWGIRTTFTFCNLERR